MRLLAAMEAWLGRELHTIEPHELTAWMAEKTTKDYDPNTVRFWLNLLRPYLRWAWKTAGLIDADRWLRLEEIDPPRGATAHSTPKPYKRTEIRAFWTALDESFPPLERPEYFLGRFERHTSPYRSLRQHFRNTQTRAIVSLALYEGLRRNEIFSIGLDELDPENAYLLVKGKRTDHRERERDVPYTDAAREPVKAWLTMRRKYLRSRHGRPWLALEAPKPQRQMSERAFAELLAKVGDGYELHRFRHTFATERLRAGMKIERLKEILGHSNLTQTLAYAKLVREDLHEEMQRSEAAFMEAVGR